LSCGPDGRDLLCKLKAQQITFDLDDTAVLKLRGPEARTLISQLHKKRNGGSMPLRGGLLKFLNFPSRFLVYRLKIYPPGLAQNVSPVVVELKLESSP
jgi:hypothetical protein